MPSSFSNQVISDISLLILKEQRDTEFREVYLRVEQLNDKYADVVRRQTNQYDGETQAVEFTLAGLFGRAQVDAHPNECSTADEIVQMVEHMSRTPMGRSILLFWVHLLFPAAVVIVDQLYYNNLFFTELFKLPASKRGQFKDELVADWVIPPQEVKDLREYTYKVYYAELRKAVEQEGEC